MRTINDIIIHCSATPEGVDYTVADIDRCHRARGWKSIGYHYVIYRDGSVHIGRPVSQIGAHCKGHNAHSIGICYIGGCDATGRHPKDTRTPEQKTALRKLVNDLLHQYLPHYEGCGERLPVHGHYHYANKACPSFKVPDEL